MPGNRTNCEPVTAFELPLSDEGTRLDRTLQLELEEDVARIFDESLYSDLELVCGKTKIRTHTCLLKTRINSLYNDLEKTLHVNFGRNAYDEIYSFISDVYTECDIKSQEGEFIECIKKHSKYSVENTCISKGKIEKLSESIVDLRSNIKIEDNPESFSTPTGYSPEGKINLNAYISTDLHKEYCCQVPTDADHIESGGNVSSPSTDLNKEYYVLVPIENNFLEKEIKEQDELSNAFHSIIKTQHQSTKKPSSLSLNSSQAAKVNRHPRYCKVEKVNNTGARKIDFPKSTSVFSSQSTESKCQIQSKLFEDDKASDYTISPDSLISNDLSSSSDYLSAANNLSPGPGCTAFPVSFMANKNAMDDVFTSLDSGLETSGNVESLSGEMDVTVMCSSLIDDSLRETLVCADSNAWNSSETQRNILEKSFKEISLNPKEEKQRHNEEIVILESSSLSSETGSWESVFPPKVSIKDHCKSFLDNERNFSTEDKNKKQQNTVASVRKHDVEGVQRSPQKAACCFIDAASLVDEDDSKTCVPNVPIISSKQSLTEKYHPPPPSQPMPCSTAKMDSSPTDWSDPQENEDSLEQTDNKDPDSLQKDLSPTIFDMTPITEDSLSTNPFENTFKSTGNPEPEETSNVAENKSFAPHTDFDCRGIMSSTPYNSMTLRSSSAKQRDSDIDSDTTIVSNESGKGTVRQQRKFTDSRILSGGASIEDHLPQADVFGSSLHSHKKIDSVSIVSGITPDESSKNIHKTTYSSSWIVDMSSKALDQQIHKKPGDRTCENLKSESRLAHFENTHSRSRSSAESDSSEVSSHTFYIDLSSLPGPEEQQSMQPSKTEKKNIFSMYIEVGNKTNVKEKPARLSASLSNRRNQDYDSSDAYSSPFNCSRISDLNNKTKDSFEVYESMCSNPDTWAIVAEQIERKEKNVLESKVKGKMSFLEKASKVKGDLSSELFVSLSDLDKPSPKYFKEDTTTLRENKSEFRMTRSIPENAWIDTQSCVSKSSEILSSFHSENALSLNRLFPHLKNEFSRSMPGSLSARTRSPAPLRLTSSNHAEIFEPTEVSKLSSVHSSFYRSNAENSTTDESQTCSLIGNCQSKLGQDLLRMFLEEIAPDVIVEVSGRRFKAHKCILSSRCQYFAGILSGGWVESSGNVILLPPFSYNVVHFALCHIYSGVSTIPDAVSIVELATLADMLGLEGLKEAIMFNLKLKYCHHFHKPCHVCKAGVLECFPLSSVYGLDDLYRKCLKWITKYFHKVWPTKAFATLPKELIDKCFQQHIINMTTDNVVDTVSACGMIGASLANSRWALTVTSLCRRLIESAVQFTGPRLLAVTRTFAGVLAEPAPPAAAALDSFFIAAVNWATPEETCRTYAFLAGIVKEIRNNQDSRPDVISNVEIITLKSNFLCARAFEWKAKCERSLVRSAPRVVDTDAFKELSLELRKRLRDLGCISYSAKIRHASTSMQEKQSKHPISRATRSQTSSSRNLDIDRVRQSFVPYVEKPAVRQRVVLAQSSDDFASAIKPSTQMPKIRTTRAQEERAKYNMTHSNKAKENVTSRATPRPSKFENTKSRYMEPRVLKDPDKKSGITNRLSANRMSSSESSRNQSPVQTRYMRDSKVKTRGAGGRGAAVASHAPSQDSLLTSSRPRTAEPSTSSLSESQTSNKYATYTKTRHGKGCDQTAKNGLSSEGANKRTRIPIYQHHHKQSSVKYNSNSTADPRPSSVSQKTNERRPPGTLTNATKSSSAKIVLRPNKEDIGSKLNTKNKVAAKQTESKPPNPVPNFNRSELRKRLRDLGCISYSAKIRHASTSMQEKQSKHPISRATRSQTSSSRNLDIDRVRQSFVPYVEKPAVRQRVVLAQSSDDFASAIKPSTQMPKIRTTRAQEERAKYNMTHSNKAKENVTSRATPRPSKFENTKSRYMEPRVLKDPDKKSGITNRLSANRMSSSESSRNQSPVQTRYMRDSKVKTRGAGGRGAAVASHAPSQDSLLTSSRPRTAEPSTSSLSESQTSNKYATYTKTRHGKGCDQTAKNGLSSEGANKRTRIPIYQHHHKQSSVKYNSNSTADPRPSSVSQKTNERRPPGTLTNATKSSSAKIVLRPNKEDIGSKLNTKNKVAAKQTESKPPNPVPNFNRSGTFLKDEPTFVDKLDVGVEN